MILLFCFVPPDTPISFRSFSHLLKGPVADPATAAFRTLLNDWLSQFREIFKMYDITGSGVSSGRFH